MGFAEWGRLYIRGNCSLSAVNSVVAITRSRGQHLFTHIFDSLPSATYLSATLVPARSSIAGELAPHFSNLLFQT